MIPKTVNGWASWAVGLGLALMTAYMLKIGEAPPMWAVLVNAALAFVALAMRGGGVEFKPPKGPGVVALLAVLGVAAAVALPACPNAYRAGWVSTAALVDARDATDKGIASAFQSKIDDCKDKHKADQISLQKCVEDSREYSAAAQWLRIIKPAIDTSVKVAKAVLEIAEKTQASKDSTIKKVLSALKDGFCKLLPAVKDWQHMFSAEAQAALKYLDLIKVVCK